MTLYSKDSQTLVQMFEKKFQTFERTLKLLSISTATPATTTVLASIQNLIDNGEIEWSADAYVNNPLLGGDIGFEAYHWFRQTTATTALAETAANALKFTGHSLYAANEGANGDIPRWARVEGWAEVGSTGGTNYDIACPLPVNFVRSGMSFIIQFICKLRTATVLPVGLEMAAMFWDNTVGQQKIIEGSAFALSYTIGGAVGATALEYKIVGRTDYGEEIESNVLSVTDAPATLTPSNYVALSWVGAAGYIDFDIYKKVGATYYLQYTVANGGTSYRDQGDAPLATVGGYPSVSITRARAYTETQGFAPSFSAWERTDIVIRTPATYDTSLTTGKQWLRLRITGAPTDARQFLIDRIGVSTGYGGWARSANDLRAANIPSTTATVSEQGDIGIHVCPGVGMELDGIDNKILTEDVRRGDKLKSRDGQTVEVTRVRFVWCDKMVRVTTDGGKTFECSKTHHLIRGNADTRGLAVSRMEKGRTVQTLEGEDTIASIEAIEPGMVCDMGVTAPYIYACNGLLHHNLKIQD